MIEMKLDKRLHRPLTENSLVQVSQIKQDMKNGWIRKDEGFIDYFVFKSAFDGLKASIQDSYAQELPIDEEYLLNCIDYWLGNIFYDGDKSDKN